MSNTHESFELDHKTLLGSMSTCASSVRIEDGGSYIHQIYTYTGDPEVSQELQWKDLDRSGCVHVAYNCDAEIKGVNYHTHERHSETWIQKDYGHVIVLPTHPRYAEYPQEEEDISPDGERGKIIAKWDVREVIPTELEY